MSKKQKRLLTYFRLEEKLVRKLDKRIARAGYTARSDFFTAVAYVALYGIESQKQAQKIEKTADVEKLPQTVVEWVSETMPSVSEEEILAGLHSVIAEMLIPVIAMKGVDVAYENTWADVRDVFHSKSGVWVTESDVREAFVSFAAVRTRELAEYRERQMERGEDS